MIHRTSTTSPYNLSTKRLTTNLRKGVLIKKQFSYAVILRVKNKYSMYIAADRIDRNGCYINVYPRPCDRENVVRFTTPDVLLEA